LRHVLGLQHHRWLARWGASGKSWPGSTPRRCADTRRLARVDVRPRKPEKNTRATRRVEGVL
jgi:hypothetical protein